MGRKTRFYMMGLSVSLASALAVGASAAVAQPASATSRDGAAQQVSVEEQVVAEGLETPTTDEAERVAANDAEQPTADMAEQSLDEAEATEDAAAEEADLTADEPLAEDAEAVIDPQAEEAVLAAEDSAAEPVLLPAAEEGSSYDPRKTEGTSAVRDQFWGTCWAQSAISTTESFMIHNGLEPTSVQFSVEDVLWWVHESGWNMNLREESGYPAMATGFLTTVGVRSEADIPYLGRPSDFADDDYKDMSPSNLYGEGENLRPANYDTAPVQYQITDMFFVKDPSMQEVKDLITQYGAVNASYHMSDMLDGYFDQEHATDWTIGRYSEDGDALIDPNHAVSVVGWDDSFPKEYFAMQNGRQPEHDGAWILKNSYGTDYGSAGGFTYVSYEDEFLFKRNKDDQLDYVYAVAGARKPVDQKRYMHDTYGAVSSWQPAESTVCTWANVFDFGAGEKLSELSFVSWSKGGSYELFYAPVSDGAPTADESSWVSLSKGTIDHAGYKTVSANWDSQVPSGKGAIVLRVTGDTPSIGTEVNLNGVSGKALFAMDEKNAKGKGYFLQNGTFSEAAIPMEAYGTAYNAYPLLSIRAYTVPASSPSDDEQPSRDVTPTPSDNQQDKGSATPSKRSSAPLPKTGDASSVLTTVIAALGAMLTLAGATLRRLQDR